jgi:NAD(P)-dependent dehydrogenase (short-subunit alcohol dehydrogenase family)
MIPRVALITGAARGLGAAARRSKCVQTATIYLDQRRHQHVYERLDLQGVVHLSP